MPYSQSNEESILDSFFNNKKSGILVDIGAADGIRYSNSRYLIESHGWSGKLLEPHPTYFNLLKKLYKDNPNIDIENCAVFSKESTMPFYLYGRDEHAQVSTLCEVFKTRVIKYHGDKFEKDPFNVKTITLNSTLSKCDTVDFLSIDCEGVDMEVLKSNNWKNNRPTLICVEKSMDINELHSFMKNINYGHYKDTAENAFFAAA